MAHKSAYTASTDEMTELFVDYLEGNMNRPALVVSNQVLSEKARTALERTFESFGFTEPTCSYATLLPHDPSQEGGDVRLDSQALFLLVESLDPLYLIATDADATQTLAAAFRTTYPTDSPIRAFGRSAVSFRDFASLLETQEGKRKAWQLLKSLK